MKRMILVTGLFLCLLISGYSQTDRETDGLKGNVKVRSKVIKDGSGEIKTEVRILYHANGMCEKRFQFKVDAVKMTLMLRKEYAYTKEGAQSETTYDGAGEMIRKQVNSFDGHGNIVSSTMQSPDGTVQNRTVWSYDSRGNVIQIAGYDPYGKMLGKSILEYNQNGERIGQKMYNGDGVQVANVEMRYSNDGQVVEKIVTGVDYPKQQRMVTLKDHKGNPTVTSQYEGTTLVKKTEFVKYDNAGNVLEEVERVYSSQLGVESANFIPIVIKTSYTYQYYK